MRGTIYLICLCFYAYGQDHTVSGFIKDEKSGESLIGSTIFESKTKAGNLSNSSGFYSLTLPQDSLEIKVSFVGHKPQTVFLYLDQDTTINFLLTSSGELEEVVIRDDRYEFGLSNNNLSSITVPIEQINTLPAFLGERDVLKVIQLLPGVQSGTEGTSGFYVRGGGPDQNLILLDGIPMYNTSHLFGFFSTFNTNAIKHVELIKGGFPARYGGRLSSVLDISMKDGNMKEIKGEASLGLISSKVTLEGPIKKDRSSFLVSGRRTYADLVAQPFIRKQTDGDPAGYYFYDVNLKLNQIINDHNRLYLSGYLGNDKAYLDRNTYFENEFISNTTASNSGLGWGNKLIALRWNHIFGPKLFSSTVLTYSKFRFDINQDYQETQINLTTDEGSSERYEYQYFSAIRDWSLKADFEYFPDANHSVRFGGYDINHRFSPGVYAYNSNEQERLTSSLVNANEGALYLEDEWTISSKVILNIGLHGSLFSVTDTTYYSLQPRTSLTWKANNILTLNTSYARMAQFIHLLTNAGVGLPTDLWVPSTNNIQPQNSDQITMATSVAINPKYIFSIEGFYKKMNNLIEYKDGASYLNTQGNWEDNVEREGRGLSYGLEFFLQKKAGDFTGWLGYTLSKSTRSFPNLNSGKPFSYKYDRRHDVSLALSYNWDDRKDFSFVWVFGTGNAITLPISTYEGAHSVTTTENGNVITYYGDRNSFRMKNYHRLDISFSWTKEKKHFERVWTLAIYNLYNRLNPFAIYIDSYDVKPKFFQLTLFPIVPSVSYSIKF